MRKSGIGFAADMNMRDTAVPKVGAILVVLLGTGMLLLNGIGTRLPVVPVVAADQGVGREAGAHDTESQALNPHSDFIFRATGATSCRGCHRIGKSGSLSPQSIDNDLVRNLREKANGIHGPGRFADCVRCHAGGSKGVEKY